MRNLILALTFFTSTFPSFSAIAQNRVRDYRRANEPTILEEFVTLLKIPNVASDRVNMRKNADLLVQMMKRRGLNPSLLEASGPDVPPVVFGEWKVPNANRTIILYAHYDGQPTDAKQWDGSLPWQPVIRSAALESGGKILMMPKPGESINPEWRLYARSASDDKAGVMAILTAVDALKAQGLAPTSNIRFFFDGEEEAGSPHLGEIIRLHKTLLEADAWIICDGPVHQSGRKQVVFGVRGDTNVDVTVYGAKRPLHSGHYGNWSPNPALILAKLLSSMKNESGRVAISGWYDDVEPLGQAEISAIAVAPHYDNELKAQLGLARTENMGKSLLELINEPSLNINGMSSGDIGALARNVIPTIASAALDLRLVKGVDFNRQFERLVEHIRKQGFQVIDHDPTDDERRKFSFIAKVVHRKGGYNAERTKMDLPISLAIIEAVQATSEEPIVKLPTSGGSLPLSIITNNLRTVTITVPIANYDNNQHAENENIRLQNLWNGIETMAALMTMKSSISPAQTAKETQLKFRPTQGLNGRTAGGARFSLQVYDSSDGVALSSRLDRFRSSGLARKELNGMVRKGKVLERRPKLDGTGRPTGERVVLKFKPIKSHQVHALVFLTDKTKLHRIESSSLHLAQLG